MGTSASKIKEEFIAEMGGDSVGTNGLVTVELTEPAYKACLSKAKRWFTSRKGYVVLRPIQISEGIYEYKMANDVAQVLDVIFQVPSDVSAFFTLGFFDIIPYGPNAMMSSASSLSSYSGMVQLLQMTEARKKVFSVDPDWAYDQQTKILHVTVRPGSTGMANTAILQLKLSDFDPVNLNDKDDMIFARWLKAEMKEAVGRVRSKYDSMPGANGPVTMDGPKLLEESKEEKELLEKEIFASQGPDLPLVG